MAEQVTCPKCGRQMEVPDGTRPDAVLHCRCGEVFKREVADATASWAIPEVEGPRRWPASTGDAASPTGRHLEGYSGLQATGSLLSTAGVTSIIIGILGIIAAIILGVPGDSSRLTSAERGANLLEAVCTGAASVAVIIYGLLMLGFGQLLHAAKDAAEDLRRMRWHLDDAALVGRQP